MAPYSRGRCPAMLRAILALRLSAAFQWLVVTILINLDGARCQPNNDCVLSLTRDLVQVLSDCNIMLDETEANHLLQSLDASAANAREPMNWLPRTLREQIPSSAFVLLLGVHISIPSCEMLWKMVERECTYLLSSTWPSPFLETGPGFLYFRRLSGAESMAERVNISCPAADWDAMLADRGSALSDPLAAPGLSPCGTAIVSSGQQLGEAIQRLQPGHARVLVTLAANISLPTKPTPQRLAVAPDDTQPLVVIYRNVTLVGGTPLVYNVSGGSSLGGVELDLRMRRNAFDLVTARQQPRPDQLGGPPILLLTDLQLVNIAPGPPSTWPLGLLSTWYYFANIDRTGSGGLQVLLLRTTMVYTEGEYSYIKFWYTNMLSLPPKDRSNGSWLHAIIGEHQMVRDDDGYEALASNVMDFFAGYNSSITNVPLLTTPSPPDFDMWSFEVTSPLPPSIFATARDATQLLALMQESWMGGLRVIFMMANITLVPGEWPQGGACLSNNVALAGPVAGAPVWLDTRDMTLVRAAVAAAGSDDVSLTLRLLRLRLVGFSPPLLTASRGDVAQAAAQGAFTGSRHLESWRDRCLGHPVGDAGVSVDNDVRFGARACVLELPKAHLALLQLYNMAAGCDAFNAANNTMIVITAACQLLQPQAYAVAPTFNNGVLAALLTGSLKAALGYKMLINTSSNPPVLVFSRAVFGGVLLLNTTALATTAAEALHEGNSATCDMETLLLALAATLAAGPPPPAAVSSPTVSNHTHPHKAALIGAVLGGVILVLVATAAVGLLIARRCRRRPQHTDKPGADPAEAPSVAIAMSTSGSGCSPDDSEANEAADLEREAGAVLQVDSMAFTLTPSEQQRAVNAGAPAMFGGGPAAAAGKPYGPPRLLPHKDAADPQRPQDDPDANKPSLRPLCAAAELKRDIERVRERCQEFVQSRSPKNIKMKLLGSGGFASVYLTEWCGMWVAVKFLMHNQGGTIKERQRLTTEAALTMSLDHPHIVPTYDVAVETLRTADTALIPLRGPAAPVGAMPAAAIPAADPPDEGEAASDHAAVSRLRLTMQYCEGGTLGAALATGKFATPPYVVSTSAPLPVAGATAAATTRPLRWEDLAPAGNMLLSLLAARDIAAALEYLHAANVVHGDLTENNVLLKAVVPHLPTSILSGPKSSAVVSKAPLDVADGVSDHRGGGRAPGVDNPEATLVSAAPAAPAAMQQQQPLHRIRDVATGRGVVVHRRAGGVGKALSLRLLPAEIPGRHEVRPAAEAAGAVAAGGVVDVREGARQSCTLTLSSSNSDTGEGSTAPVVGRLAVRRSNTTVTTPTLDGWAMRIFWGTISTAPSESDGRDPGPTGVSSTGAESDSSRLLVTMASRLCRWSFKLSDFGLSVQLQGASQTHMSNRYQGTPVFAAPEVMESGRLSPAADVYSFGVLLWLLLHGVSLKQIRPLLPRILFGRPVGEDLLRHTCNRLPTAAVELVRQCLVRDPAQRTSAAQLKSAVEGLLKDAAGPTLYQLLMGMERYELLCGRPDVHGEQPMSAGIPAEAESGVEAVR